VVDDETPNPPATPSHDALRSPDVPATQAAAGAQRTPERSRPARGSGACITQVRLSRTALGFVEESVTRGPYTLGPGPGAFAPESARHNCFLSVSIFNSNTFMLFVAYPPSVVLGLLCGQAPPQFTQRDRGRLAVAVGRWSAAARSSDVSGRRHGMDRCYGFSGGSMRPFVRMTSLLWSGHASSRSLSRSPSAVSGSYPASRAVSVSTAQPP
jgi:hypothetical protein